jgi:hypothetical protein
MAGSIEYKAMPLLSGPVSTVGDQGVRDTLRGCLHHGKRGGTST